MPSAGSMFTGLPIVVGVEGAEPGLAATRWAAIEARLRRLPLWLVHTCPPRQAWAPAGPRYPDADTILATAVGVARAEAASVQVTGQQHTSPPAQTLIALSGHASMVVVGHRGHGCGSPLHELRSPVASAVTAHAHGSVVVVRPGTSPVTRTGPVVVGVDGSTAATVALGFAFQEAALRNVPLEVVRALPPGRGTDLPADLDAAERQLYGWVRPWQDIHPRLPVSITVTPAHPIAVLTRASRQAHLLVVGARGGAHRLPVGSVSQQLVHLAACPVLVVRATAQAERNVPATVGTATLADRPDRVGSAL